MRQRRARNIVSRSQAMSLRCAELLDEGATDGAAAKALANEFKQPVKAKAVAAFRREDYAPVQAERLARRDSAKEVGLIIGAATDAGATFAQAGTDLLSKMLYDVIRAGGVEDPVAVGKVLAKFQELEIQKIKAETERSKADAAQRIKDSVKGKTITKEDLVATVDQVLGLKKAS